MSVCLLISISKHHKNIIKYPLDLHISRQALPTLPIPRSINLFLLTIINHVHGKSRKHGKTDKTRKITLKWKIRGKWDFNKTECQK